jgi:hypothetical protein
MDLRDFDWRFFKHQDHDRSRWNWDSRKKKHTAVPEPGSLLMLVAGLGIVTGAARRKVQELSFITPSPALAGLFL